MNSIKKMYMDLGISENVYEYCNEKWNACKDNFAQIDSVSEYNQLKVLTAMQNNKISDAHLLGSTGYGYTDIGRDALERVYADVFHTDAALVRPQITCGTHALTVALSANLLPGDELLSPVGLP